MNKQVYKDGSLKTPEDVFWSVEEKHIYTLGEAAHLIRQGTYLELLPTPIHNFKATSQWLNEEAFRRNVYPNDVGKTAVRTIEVVSGAVVGVLVTRKLLQMLGDDDKSQKV